MGRRSTDGEGMLAVMAEKGDPRFERAAARFAARATLERGLEPADAHRVLGLAQSLPASPGAVVSLLHPFVSSRPPA